MLKEIEQRELLKNKDKVGRKESIEDTKRHHIIRVLESLFKIETNPYIIWKEIHALQPSYFVPVFKDQSQEFGVNFNEVNEILSFNKEVM